MKPINFISGWLSRIGLPNLAVGLITSGVFLTLVNSAEAHLTYGTGNARNLGSFSGLTNGTAAITNQVCTGNFGWADGADGVLGDTHKIRALRFQLANPAFVSFTVAANPNATGTSLGDLTPAFSIYSGLAAIAPFSGSQNDSDHDGSPASLAWRTWWVQQNIDTNATTEAPTDGCFNALGNWQIGGAGDPTNDFSQLSSFIYKGSATSTTSGGSVTGNFSLPAGDYTVIIGGNDIINKTGGSSALSRGISATLSVSPTPSVFITPKVFLALPTGDTNWVLEAASSVNSTNWSAVNFAPVSVSGQRGVLLDSGAATQFFRLRSNP